MSITQLLTSPQALAVEGAAAVAILGFLTRAVIRFIDVKAQSEVAHQTLLASQAASEDQKRLHSDTANLVNQLNHFADAAVLDFQAAVRAGLATPITDAASAQKAGSAALTKMKALGGADLTTQLSSLLGIGESVADDYLQSFIRVKLHPLQSSVIVPQGATA